MATPIRNEYTKNESHSRITRGYSRIVRNSVNEIYSALKELTGNEDAMEIILGEKE